MRRKPSKLKLALIEAGVLAYELGHAVGISESKMCALSTGRSLPTVQQAKALAKKLKVPVDSLFDEFKKGDMRLKENWEEVAG
jgi:DNA-binding XRE family transcriptional regulator